MDEDNINQEESELKLTPTEVNLPPELEDKTIKALYHKNLIKRNNKLTYIRLISGIAAGIILFAAGVLWGKQNDQSPNSWSYVLLLYEDKALNTNNANLFNEYAAWAKEIKKNSIEITGEKLSDERVLVGVDSSLSQDNKVKLTGYFLIQSSSMKQAIELAEKSPHIKYGGQIEIRKIETE